MATGPGDDTTVGWSPDGKWLLFSIDLISNIGNFRALGFSSSGALYYGTENRFLKSQLSLGSIDYTARKFSAVEMSRNPESRLRQWWN